MILLPLAEKNLAEPASSASSTRKSIEAQGHMGTTVGHTASLVRHQRVIPVGEARSCLGPPQVPVEYGQDRNGLGNSRTAPTRSMRNSAPGFPLVCVVGARRVISISMRSSGWRNEESAYRSTRAREWEAVILWPVGGIGITSLHHSVERLVTARQLHRPIIGGSVFA
jgi:hypothetical protein